MRDFEFESQEREEDERKLGFWGYLSRFFNNFLQKVINFNCVVYNIS